MGIDERDVVPARDVKSIGHEKTFAADILEIDSANQEILSLANKVARRMRRDGITGRTITLKVKYSDFVQISRSTTLPKSTDDGLEIYSTARGLLEKTQVGRRPIRLLGVSLSQLSLPGSGEQLSLFNQGRGSQRRKQLNTALDSLSERFGEDSIRPATLLTK
jgi:DNA polymerase-4